jgi:hypothetical protein
MQALAMILTEDFKLTDWLIVLFTLVLTIVAIKQYLLGKSQDEHFEKSERAWILVELGWPVQGSLKVGVTESRDTESGELVGTTFINPIVLMKNEGKSPAFIDEIKAAVIVRDKFVEEDLPDESEFRNHGYVQPIGEGKNDSLRLALTYPAKKPHELSFSIHIRVEYHDIFGVKRLTTTAYVMDTGFNLYKQEAFRSWHLNT